MKKVTLFLLMLLTLSAVAKPKAKKTVETWPDGTEMDAWFQNPQKVDVGQLGRRYVLTDYGVLMGSSEVQTQQIQACQRGRRRRSGASGYVYDRCVVLQAGHPSACVRRWHVERL